MVTWSTLDLSYTDKGETRGKCSLGTNGNNIKGNIKEFVFLVPNSGFEAQVRDESQLLQGKELSGQQVSLGLTAIPLHPWTELRGL